MEPVNAPRRVLFAACYPSPSVHTSESLSVGDAYEEFFETQECSVQVVVVEQPSLEELKIKVEECRPNIVYCTGGTSSGQDILSGHQNPLSFADKQPVDDAISIADASAIANAFKEAQLNILYIDAPLTSKQVGALKSIQCCEHLIFWPREQYTSSAIASQFAHCFFGLLRNPGVTFAEAFAMSSRSVQLLCENILKERPHVQLLPNYISHTEPDLPQCSSVPVEPIPDIPFLDDDIPQVEGWENVLLLAPKAEVRLLLCGGPSMIDPLRLSQLGEALRALLLTEMRCLTVTEIAHCDRIPSNITENSTAVRCHIQCASGIETVVVLGGPPSILSNMFLVQHALRQTLAVDSLCLQFRLPPPSFPPTTARSSASVAGGTPVVDALVVTSVWAVHILRGLCQNRHYRGLVSFGIAGVGGSALTHFKPSDTVRYNAIVTGIQNPPLARAGNGGKDILVDKAKTLPHPRSKTEVRQSRHNGDMDVDLMDSLDNDSDYELEIDADYEASSKASHEHVIMPTSHVPTAEYHSTRPLLSSCTETEFYDDLIAFTEAQNGKTLDRERFPEAVLNGGQLDLFNLYKEVVSRGGFCVGNGINWKGQVFPKMRNWTSKHRMTGVGNALKRHYQTFLRDYELAHPKDLTGDGCWLCGSKDESGTDWICCDNCERWIHFACDRRPFLGTFKDYATGDGGRTYHCPRCTDVLKHK